MTAEGVDPPPSRDVVVLGGSGVLSTWLWDLVIAACERCEPPVEARFAGTGQSVADVGRRGEPARALLVRQPDGPVLDLLGQGTAPTVAAIDDPVDMVRISKARLQGDLRLALRDQTSSAIAHHLLRDRASTLLVRRGQAGRARDIAKMVLNHLGLALDKERQAIVIDAFAGPPGDGLSLEAALARRIENHVPLDQLADRVKAEEMSIVRQVLSPMLLAALQPDIGRIVWPQKIFWSHEGPELTAPRVLDLAGGARTLFFGPYFHLPAARWRATLLLAFSVEASRMPFRLVVQCNLRPIVQVNFRATEPGACEAAFSFRHDDPEHAVEINLMMDEGSIEGHIALGQLTLERLDG